MTSNHKFVFFRKQSLLFLDSPLNSCSLVDFSVSIFFNNGVLIYKGKENEKERKNCIYSVCRNGMLLKGIEQLFGLLLFFYYIDMRVLLEKIPLVKFIKTTSVT